MPHSDTHGSKLARSSPWFFAACHVLHRLLVPRHPPNALLILKIYGPSLRTNHVTHHAQEPSTPNLTLSSFASRLRPKRSRCFEPAHPGQFTQHTHVKCRIPITEDRTLQNASERICHQQRGSHMQRARAYRSDFAADDAPRDAPEPDSH